MQTKSEKLKREPGKNCATPKEEEICCSCCGKPGSELKPFDRYRDCSFDDHPERFLVKHHRAYGPLDEEAEQAFNEALYEMAEADIKDGDPLEWMIEKYGKEKGEKFYGTSFDAHSTFSSIDCRDCIGLGTDEYWEKRNRRIDK
jgi:hypothetical protein